MSLLDRLSPAHPEREDQPDLDFVAVADVDEAGDVVVVQAGAAVRGIDTASLQTLLASALGAARFAGGSVLVWVREDEIIEGFVATTSGQLLAAAASLTPPVRIERPGDPSELNEDRGYRKRTDTCVDERAIKVRHLPVDTLAPSGSGGLCPALSGRTPHRLGGCQQDPGRSLRNSRPGTHSRLHVTDHCMFARVRGAHLCEYAAPPGVRRFEGVWMMSELRASEAYRGFVASVPSLSIASNGNQRLSFRFGQEQWTRSEDGEFTQGESLFTDAVMWGDRAERAHDVLRRGHVVVAAGVQRERSFTGREGEDVAIEELEIYRIGPDVTHRYMAVTADRLTKAMLDRFAASAAALRAETTVERATSAVSPVTAQRTTEGVLYEPPAGQADSRPNSSL